MNAALSDGKIPSLDGLRAISIALVVVGHLHATRGFPELGLEHILGDYGLLGVRVFFVISGFLITTLLMRELEQHGRISLRAFYARRSLRIFPAAFAFIGAMALADSLGWIELRAIDVVAALTYTVNFVPDPSWEFGHLWSLSVEEQFYILWPFALARLGVRRGAWVALAFFVAAPLVRTAMRLAFHGSPMEDMPIFPAVCDGIAICCLFAIGREWLLRQPLYLRFTRSPAMLLLVPLIFAIHHLSSGYTLADLFGYPLMLLAIATIVEASTRLRQQNLAGRILNWPPLVWLGMLSYSLYLWQQPFLNHYSHSVFAAFPLNLAMAIGLGMLSYYLLERPLLRLRQRYSRIQAPSLRDGAPP
jgi:peptidoglycan/LPS O-acetylase OafA/YrhL